MESDNVTGFRESVEAQERLDELRRRLYRDGAGEEDLRRYAEVRDSILRIEQPRTEGPDAPPAPPLRRRRRAFPIAAVAVAALLLAGVGAGIAAKTSPVHPHAASTPTPKVTAAPDPVSTAEPQDIGDGQLLVQDASVVTAPSTLSVSIDGSVANAQQFEGTGDAVVPLDVSTAGFSGGRGVVVLSSEAVAPVDWRVLRTGTRTDWTSYQEVLAQGTVLAGSPAPSPILFDYPGNPPTHLAIQAPHGLRWTLLVVFLGPTGSTKR